MNKRTQQHGFSIVLVIIAVLLLTAGVGWYVWSRNTGSNKSTTETSTPSQTTPAAYDPSEGGRYLVIKEWGLRIALSDKIKDIKYELSNNGGAEAVRFRTDSLEKLRGCEGLPWGIERGKPGDPMGIYTVDYYIEHSTAGLKKIDDYYFLPFGPQDTCVTPLPEEPGCNQQATNYPDCLGFNTPDQHTFDDLDTNIRQAMDTVEKIPNQKQEGD